MSIHPLYRTSNFSITFWKTIFLLLQKTIYGGITSSLFVNFFLDSIFLSCWDSKLTLLPDPDATKQFEICHLFNWFAGYNFCIIWQYKFHWLYPPYERFTLWQIYSEFHFRDYIFTRLQFTTSLCTLLAKINAYFLTFNKINYLVFQKTSHIFSIILRL